MKIRSLILATSLLVPVSAWAQSAPAWKSYQDTGNPADMVKSTQVASWLGLKVDVANGTLTSPTITGGTMNDPTITGGTATNLTLSGGLETTTPAAGDNGSSIPNTFYVDRAVTNGFSTVASNPSLIGFQTTYKTTINVCPSGCTYSDPVTAWGDAIAQAHKLNGTMVIEIDIADGTYNETNNFYVPDPMGKFIDIVGDTSDPSKVVLNFTATKGTNFNAFDASNGGMIGLIDGVTITQPSDGTGALASTNSSGEHTWNSDSYGGAVAAYGAGSNIQLGPHVIISNFYYSLIADDMGGVYAPSGLTMSVAGDVNAMARGGGTIVCLGCTATDVSDVTWSGTTLGSNFDAERGGTLYIDGSTGSKSLVNGLVAQTGGSVWAHKTKFTTPLVQDSGSAITGWTGGHIEATSSSVSGGYYADVTAADTAIVACDDCTLTGGKVGIVADGGRARGTGMTITNNTQYGIQAIHQGTVIGYSTYANMSGNGTNFSAEAAGTNSVSGSSYTASSIDVQ